VPVLTSHGRSIGRDLLVAVLATIAVACAPAPGPGVRQVTDLVRHLGPSDTPPPEGAPGWQPITLPDYWGPQIREHAIEGWAGTART
jgi:hypothetical protein